MPQSAPTRPFSPAGFRTLEALDAEIVRVKAYLSDLLAERNLRAPISRLPDEVLVNVFKFSTDIPCPAPGEVFESFDVDQITDHIALSRLFSVCRRWHFAISNHTALWSMIHCIDWKNVPTLLEKSANSPLTIEWASSSIHNSSRGASTDASAIDKALIAIFHQVSRIRHLNLKIENRIHKNILQTSFPSSSAVLERLKITSSARTGLNPIPLNLIRADRLHSLHLYFPLTLDFTLCQFPQLQDAFFNFDSEPPLIDILKFFSSSPLLRTIRFLSFDSIAFNSGSRPQQTVNLPNLRSFRCVVRRDTSSLLRVLKHCRIPQGCAIEFGMDQTSWSSSSEAETHFASFLPFAPDDVSVHELDLVNVKDGVSFEAYCHPTNLDHSIHWRFHSSSNSNVELDGDLHIGFVALQRNTCNLTSLDELSCAILLQPSTWRALFSSCTQLTTLTLRLDAVAGFLSFFVSQEGVPEPSHELSHAPSISNLPFPMLKAITVAEGGPDLVTGCSWAGVLSGFARSLEIRASFGYRLETFFIDRRSPWCFDEDDKYYTSDGWDEEVLFVDRIRELVDEVDIETFSDSDSEQFDEEGEEDNADDTSSWDGASTMQVDS